MVLKLGTEILRNIPWIDHKNPSHRFCYFFFNSKKNFLDYGSTTRNSMHNLNIQCVFLNNLIFQLLNCFILPNSMLAT
ncbi:hypothetical protein HanIR_Chr02g0063931 [Helianthus annuus]|nr:hypothetical protein HanIR_Chr02g0063931 [Helianthus annuus]